MNNPKVLVAIPYHPVKNYCLWITFEAANNLTYKNKEVILRCDPSEYGSENAVKNQREFFRKLALEKDFDYLYFMGCDTIPPADVIESLLAHEKDIVGGVYWGRHNATNGNCDSAVAWIHELSQENQSRVFNTPDQLLSIDGMGMDAVLISRSVLEKISWLDWKQNDDDYPFYDKAKSLGFKTFIDTNVQCKHYFTENGYSFRGAIVGN